MNILYFSVNLECVQNLTTSYNKYYSVLKTFKYVDEKTGENSKVYPGVFLKALGSVTTVRHSPGQLKKESQFFS